MTKKMRRYRQLLSHDRTIEIIYSATNGILSLIDSDGTPYGVPLSFAYDGDKSIYFHSATEGRKIDCIDKGCPCSFCVVAQDQIVPEKFTTYYRSVIVSGRISILNDRDDIIKGLQLLCRKYSPGIDSDTEIAKCLTRVSVLRLEISQITGKEAIELAAVDRAAAPQENSYD